MSLPFTIGFQPRRGREITEIVLQNKERIREVYFAWGDFSSGRGRLKSEAEQQATEDALAKFSEAKIGLDLLLNAECFGGESLARKLYIKIGDTVDDL